MIDFVAENEKWVVIPRLMFFIHVPEGSQFTANHQCEIFDDEESATERAYEVGWTPDKPDDGDWDWDAEKREWVEAEDS